MIAPRPGVVIGMLSLLLASAPALAGEADPLSYSARLITPGLSAISSSAMNNAGDVVGTSTTGTGAWVSRDGAPAVLLPVPPGKPFAYAHDINDAGVICGSVNSGVYE